MAKFSRPQKRCVGILFSPQAVVSEVNGQRRLMFRVTNLLPEALVDVSVSGILYEEHDDHTLDQTAVEFTTDNLGSRPCPLFVSPLTYFHPLTPSSPLHNVIKPSSQSRFELVVFLSASKESTGCDYHKRTSYLPDEIEHDRCFVKSTPQHGKARKKNARIDYFDTQPCTQTRPIAYGNNTLEQDHVAVQINGEGSDRAE